MQRQNNICSGAYSPNEDLARNMFYYLKDRLGITALIRLLCGVILLGLWGTCAGWPSCLRGRLWGGYLANKAGRRRRHSHRPGLLLGRRRGDARLWRAEFGVVLFQHCQAALAWLASGLQAGAGSTWLCLRQPHG